MHQDKTTSGVALSLRSWAGLSTLVLGLAALFACVPSTPGPSPTPLPNDTPTPTPTWAVTPHPTATPLPPTFTPTLAATATPPLPTPTLAVTATLDSVQPIALPAATPTFSPEAVELRQLLGEEGYAVAVPPGEDLLNWVAADLDGDGEDEVAVRTCPGSCDESGAWSQGHFRVLKVVGDAHILSADGSTELAAGLEVDSTFNFQPGFDVMQVRPDGGLGIVEQSACGVHSLCLNLYTWDGTSYRVFPFSGSAMGVEVYPDGTVAVGNRDYFTDPISNGWTGIYRWDGMDYVLETVAFEGPDYEGPTGIVRAYYNAINICVYEESFRAAYAYLSRGFQATHPYAEFEAGFANTVRVAVGDVTLMEESADSAVVKVTITATDEVDGVEQDTCYTITWWLVKEDDTWKLDQAQVRIPVPPMAQQW